MISRVTGAEAGENWMIHLVFVDGTEGDVDLSRELDGEIFEPLRDPAYFRRFHVDPDLHTLVWPNGADFAPEFLYEKVKVRV
jgi:hypothetical protein